MEVTARKKSGPETIGLHRGRLPGVLHGECALPSNILPVQYDTQGSQLYPSRTSSVRRCSSHPVRKGTFHRRY